MKIYSMTATFGKLNGQTLTLKPGLNVIQAPNEWGKSTWCAFLTAMFYGLDTRSHTTKNALSDKERYTPWSGAAMSGRIDLNWDGRDITIERKTKGRTIFGDFRAYETESGLPVPELTAQTCGLQLLGVERAVFTRSAMIRQADLPVTQDETLRRRLNALVTTGDDSGAAENLERRLRDLKNRCRYNRTGLLPQAEAEAAGLDQKLRELDDLELQSRKLRQRITDLQQHISQLENHRTAMAYHAAQENALRRRNAEEEARQLGSALETLESECAGLPACDQARQTADELRRLQAQWAQIRMESERSQSIPEHPLFHGLSPEDALAQVHSDESQYRNLRRLHLLYPILTALVIFAGVAALIWAPAYPIYGYAAIAAGVLGMLIWGSVIIFRFAKAAKIAAVYGGPEPSAWISAAEDYVNLCRDIEQTEASRHASIEDLRRQTALLCQGRPLSETLTYWQIICDRWDRLNTARNGYRMWEERLSVLNTLPVEAPAPAFPDMLTLTEAQTHRALADATGQLQELQLRLGQCQGQMEATGHRATLELRRDTVTERIRRLEDTYAALELALSTLEQARATLQRRFAPRISARAQEILNRLTEGKYDRLVLDRDLTLQATATDEHTLRTALWRSDGTADLLYLALRLAVSAELVPDAPLILDDALVRFDDRRLQQTVSVLKEESAQRQIILFTCHSRETQYL